MFFGNNKTITCAGYFLIGEPLSNPTLFVIWSLRMHFNLRSEQGLCTSQLKKFVVKFLTRVLFQKYFKKLNVHNTVQYLFVISSWINVKLNQASTCKQQLHQSAIRLDLLLCDLFLLM